MPKASTPRSRAVVDPSRSARGACAGRAAALDCVPRTLLIPLAARAQGARYFPWLDCDDHVAAGWLAQLSVDVSPYLDDLPTVFTVLWRTRAIRAAGQAFFAAHPDARGVNLGCGLSHYFQWLDTGCNRWLDADLPEVLALRQRLLAAPAPRHRQGLVDLRRPDWWEPVTAGSGGRNTPLLLVCEGVLMYLEPAQVQAVLHTFAEQAPPGSRLVLDVMAQGAVGHAARHASVGRTGAEFRWGVDRVGRLCEAHPRLRLLAEHSVSDSLGWAGWALEAAWRPWVGGPFYSVVTLGV